MIKIFKRIKLLSSTMDGSRFVKPNIAYFLIVTIFLPSHSRCNVPMTGAQNVRQGNQFEVAVSLQNPNWHLKMAIYDVQ